MASLTIRFNKKRDGGASITYTRPDGTSTGQRGAHDFFVYHDIGHYAAETTLGLQRAFLGTVARGWDLDDFGSPWPRGRFPESDLPDLMLAESMAGALDLVRYNGQPLDLAEIQASLQAVHGEERGSALLPVTEDEWIRIRDTANKLTGQWEGLPPGDSLILEWG